MSRKDIISRLKLKTHPADRAILLLLSLALIVALIRWPAVGVDLTPLIAVHVGLFVGFFVCCLGMGRWESAHWIQFVRPFAVIILLFTLYASLGKLGLAAMPYRADEGLWLADKWLLGFDPSLALQPYQTFGRIEFFSFVYGSFIPYIYLSLFLGCLGRPPLERDQFLTGWVFTYFISYLGYLFLPANGPVLFQAEQYIAPLNGGFFHNLVVTAIDSVGGPKGAFPSLHIGASVYLCLFDLRTNRLRGMTYLPLILLIYMATVFLRYHYVVDLIAGTAIAVVSLTLGNRVFRRWARARQTAGLPALPGGEGDVLPVLSADNQTDAPLVFSAD